MRQTLDPGVSPAVLWAGKGQGIAMYGATNNVRGASSCEYTSVELVAVAEAVLSSPAPADRCGGDDKDVDICGVHRSMSMRVMP